EFSLFIRIVIPGITPALASWGAISLIARWNDFMLPMIFLRSPLKQTLMVAISLLPVSDGLSTPWPVVMAGVATATFPLIIAFILLQKFDIADLMAGSTKG
ncbi:MAG: carbohydrate ABC transporter permease, partial [Bacilli bacterium]